MLKNNSLTEDLRGTIDRAAKVFNNYSMSAL